MADQKISDESVWQFMQQRLKYTDAEIEKFKADPRNHKLMLRAEELGSKTVIFEVVQTHGCNVEHAVGDQFHFSAGGFMLAHKGPAKVCPYIMPAMARMMWLIQERIYEGLEPRPMFYQGHCEDVGLACGGWGRVVIEAKIVDR